MKLSNIFSLLAVASPLASVSALKGAKVHKETVQHRVLKGDDGGGDSGGLEDIADLACFSEVSTVQVEGQGPVAMKDLELGQKVLTGSNQYQPVYAFGHYKEDEPANFVQLYTDNKTPLEMTGDHLVFLEGKANPVRADSVKVGDVLKGINAGAPVSKIGTIKREGVYAPFTPEGSVVVDGIVASSYISLQATAEEYVQLQNGMKTSISQHTYVHMGLSPFRLLCMGVSSSFCADYNEEGMPSYPAFAVALNKWAHSQNIVIQSLVLMAVMILTGACLMLEKTFGASLAPLAVVLTGASLALVHASGLKGKANKVKSV